MTGIELNKGGAEEQSKRAVMAWNAGRCVYGFLPIHAQFDTSTCHESHHAILIAGTSRSPSQSLVVVY